MFVFYTQALFAVVALCSFGKGGVQAPPPFSLQGRGGWRATLPPLSPLLKWRLKRPANQRRGDCEEKVGVMEVKAYLEERGGEGRERRR